MQSYSYTPYRSLDMDFCSSLNSFNKASSKFLSNKYNIRAPSELVMLIFFYI